MKKMEFKKSIKWYIMKLEVDSEGQKTREYYIEDDISKPIRKYEDSTTYIDYFVDVFGSLFLVYTSLPQNKYDSVLFKDPTNSKINKIDKEDLNVYDFMSSLYNYMYSFRQDIAKIYRLIKKIELDKKSVHNILSECGIETIKIVENENEIIKNFNEHSVELRRIVELYESINSYVDKYSNKDNQLSKLKFDFLIGENDVSLYNVYNGLINIVSKEVYEITYNIDIEVSRLISKKEGGYK